MAFLLTSTVFIREGGWTDGNSKAGGKEVFRRQPPDERMTTFVL